jgi:hypothetical protein
MAAVARIALVSIPQNLEALQWGRILGPDHPRAKLGGRDQTGGVAAVLIVAVGMSFRQIGLEHQHGGKGLVSECLRKRMCRRRGLEGEGRLLSSLVFLGNPDPGCVM